jgi:hypothetical protein
LSTGTGTTTFNNQSGGQFNILGGATWTGGGSVAFNNQAGATLTKSSGGTSLFANGIALNNNGTVNVNAGTLQLDGGGTSTGAFSIASGAKLDFGFGNTHTLSGSIANSGTLSNSGATTNFSGTYTEAGGVIAVSGGTFNVNSSLSSASLNLSGGTLSGTGDLIVTDNFTQTGGSVDGSYQKLVLTHQNDFLVQLQNYSAKDTLTLAASGTITVDGRTLSAPNVILVGGNGVTLRSSTSAQSLVDATTSLNVNTASLVLDGTNGPAKLQSAGTMVLDVGSVNVTAGLFPASIDPTNLSVTATGDIVLTGGASPNASAMISGNNVTASGANIILNGGAGSGSFAAIEAIAGNANVTASNAIIMNPGAGANSDAIIAAPPGLLSLNSPSCVGCGVLGSNPLSDPATNQGLFGSTVLINGVPTLPPTSTDISTLIQIDNSIIYAATLAGTGGEANTSYSGEAEEEQNGDNPDVKEEGKNDAKPKRNPPMCI